MRKLSLTFFCMISALSAFGRTMCLLHRTMNRATKITASHSARRRKITAASAPVRARCSAMSESRSRRKFHNSKTQDLHLAGPVFFHAAMQKMGYSPSSTARRRRTLPSSAASMVWISASRSRLSVPPRGR